MFNGKHPGLRHVVSPAVNQSRVFLVRNVDGMDWVFGRGESAAFGTLPA